MTDIATAVSYYSNIFGQPGIRVLQSGITLTWRAPCWHAMIPWPMDMKFNNPGNFMKTNTLINLCFNTKREHWEKAIAKHNISGNNYLLTGDQTNILKNILNFSAIPHQVIVDKAGNIADNNAPSPHGKGGTLSPILMDQLMAFIQNQE